jgi:hypothetical protein
MNYFELYGLSGSRDISIGIMTGYGLDGRGSITDRVKIFLYSTASIPALRPTRRIIQWIPGALSLRVKRLGSHLVSRSSMVNRYLQSPNVFMAWRLIKLTATLPYTDDTIHQWRLVTVSTRREG